MSEPLTRNDEKFDFVGCTDCGEPHDSGTAQLAVTASKVAKANLSDEEFKRVVLAFKVLAKVRDRIRNENR